MKKILVIIGAIIVLFQVTSAYKEDYYIIPNESIRIRIIPNSNNIKDQYLKNQVKASLESEVEKDLTDSKTIEQSRKIINKNLNKYSNNIKKTLKNEHSNQKYKINYGNHHFPRKKYKGVVYKEGDYESLLITLGNGKGDNWWCVLFPPICTFETDEAKNKDIEYSLYIKEMFDKYIK